MLVRVSGGGTACYRNLPAQVQAFIVGAPLVHIMGYKRPVGQAIGNWAILMWATGGWAPLVWAKGSGGLRAIH